MVFDSSRIVPNDSRIIASSLAASSCPMSSALRKYRRSRSAITNAALQKPSATTLTTSRRRMSPRS
jgi:hypothetical protein